MSNDVVLTAALRSNLLSLQQTQTTIDVIQLRLATGRKVNSALDNPQAFFASQALNNRASDLTRLLDGIGQSIQVIKAADNGITALTRLVEQANSVAKQARDVLAAGQAEAKVEGSRDLRGINDLDALPGIAAGDTLVMSVTTEDGTPVNLGAYGTPAGATATITIAANESIEELMTDINNLHLDDGVGQSLGVQAFEATLDEGGRLSIRTLNGGDFRVSFATAAATDTANLALAADLGLANVSRLIPAGGTGANSVEFTSVADVALVSFPLYNSGTGEFAQASSTFDLIQDSTGANLFANINSVDDEFRISIDGGPVQSIELTALGVPLSIQSFVDQINANSALNGKIEASYDETTGQMSLTPIDGLVESIEVGVRGDGADGATANMGFGLTNLISGATGQEIRETVRLAAAAGQLAALENDFDNLRTQMTELVSNGDTAYRGTNLLNGDNLFTVFNEFRTSSLTTEGVTFTADGLGITEGNFSRISSTEAILDQVREALASVRNFGGSLANDLSIIQTREDYSKNLINTLTEGSDKLTVADQNEEGAKLLALQTRQQLGVTSLSLASQSQQSILRLFG